MNSPQISKILTINTDGGSRGNPGQAGLGFVVYDEHLNEIMQSSIYLGVKTNNQAEYLGFLASLKWLVDQNNTSLHKVIWKLDSKLVVEQINGNWKIKDKELKKIAEKCKKLLATLPYSYELVHVKRDKNKKADALANQAIDLGLDLI